MGIRSTTTRFAAAAVLLGVAWAASSDAADTTDATEVAEKPDRSITVFPIMIKPQLDIGAEFPRRIAAVLGLFLEKAGLEQIDLGEATFESPDTDDMQRLGADFGRFVVKQKIETEHALYCEILGTPQTGPKEIRTVLVDRRGKVLMADRDDDKTYAQTTQVRPKDPMSCCIFMAYKMKRQWDLADPMRSDAPEGKMAAWWANQSGQPTEGERAAMRRRAEKLKQQVGTATVAVYPISVEETPDRECAAQLVALLNGEKLCRASVAQEEPKLKIPHDSNEQKVLWDTARAIRKFVEKHPPTTDYVVYADYRMGRSSSGEVQVGYTHFIVCDREKKWVAVDFQNSHHADFQQIAPKSKEDCNRLAIRRLKGLLAE